MTRGSSATSGQWTTGLFGCFEDCPSCWLTLFCPCVAVGRIAETVNKGETSCCCAGASFVLISLLGFQCFYTGAIRTKLRDLFSLPGNSCADCCVHYWCALCSMSQEYRELVNRGLDPSQGWELNARKMESAATSAPSVATGMVR